jgi:hypothetical protein
MVLYEVPTANDGWVSNFDQFFVGLPIKLIEAATSNVGSTPRLAEDVVRLVPVFPPGSARGASSVPALNMGLGRQFYAFFPAGSASSGQRASHELM